MYASQVLATAIMATGVLAAPTQSSQSMMAAIPQWTIESLNRDCGSPPYTNCTWNFNIDTHASGVKPTVCKYVVYGDSKTPGWQSAGGPSKCGDYQITSQWSNQFGSDPHDTFTVLSVIDEKKHLIVYPGYTDQQLRYAAHVKPDQSYAPQSLPSSA